MSNVKSIFPANDFETVATGEAKELEAGIIIGYDKDGALAVYAGGMLDGRQPVAKDWLWVIERFKAKLLAGDYAGE